MDANSSDEEDPKNQSSLDQSNTNPGSTLDPEVLVGCGFWLPCGRSNFFDSNRDEKLMSYYQLSQAASIEDPAATQSTDGKRLQVSVYRRLTLVLAEKGYTHAIPIIPRFRMSYSDSSEPEAAIFLHDDMNKAKPEEWLIPPSASKVVLLVTCDGFYLWLAKCAKTSVGRRSSADTRAHSLCRRWREAS